MNKQLQTDQYELQKAHDGSTETVKLSCYHTPYRLFLGLTFLFDIILDVLVIIELADNNIDQNFLALLIFFCLSFFGMTLVNCGNIKTAQYPGNGILRLFFALFGLIGLDSILYFIYSALTLEGHTLHDYKINGPRSARKVWGVWQSVLSSFITAHYVFYYPDSSVIAVISLFSSMLQARLSINMTHTHKTFVDLIKNDIFCMRFVSTFFEILGRPLFFGATTIIIIDSSSFLSNKSQYHLTYEFFAWDGIALGSTCFLFFFLYQAYFKNFKISLSLMVQNFIGSMLIRPAIDKNDLQSVKIVSKMVVYLDDKSTNERQLKRQLQFGLGFPCVWRIIEYIALIYIIFDYEVLKLAEERDDSILYLAYITIIANLINSFILLISLFIILTVSPKFDLNHINIPKQQDNKQQILAVKEEKEVGQKSESIALRDQGSVENQKLKIDNIKE